MYSIISKGFTERGFRDDALSACNVFVRHIRQKCRLHHLRGLTLPPTIRFSQTFAALVLATIVGVAYWPSGVGLASTLIALLLLLPLTLVCALDAVRFLKSRSPTPGAAAMRIALSLPLGLLALLALVISIAFAIILVANWSTASPRALIGGLIAGAMFLVFGIKLLQALWSRKHDKTIPYHGGRPHSLRSLDAAR